MWRQRCCVGTDEEAKMFRKLMHQTCRNAVFDVKGNQMAPFIKSSFPTSGLLAIWFTGTVCLKAPALALPHPAPDIKWPAAAETRSRLKR